MVVNKKNKESGNLEKEVSSDNSNKKQDKDLKLWKITSAVLGVLCLILLVIAIRGSVTGGVITGQVVSENVAAQNLVDFAKAFDVDLEIVSVEDNGYFYEVMALMEGNVIPFTITKDGEYLLEGSLVSLDERPTQEQETTQTQQQETSSYSEEDLLKLKEFNDCLAENGMVIYGSDWCPFCTELVEKLGGYEAVENVYVECTENQELCQEEMIGTGVPEIQINGEMYQGERTIEAIAQATGCEVPDLSENTNPTTTAATASC